MASAAATSIPHAPWRKVLPRMAGRNPGPDPDRVGVFFDLRRRLHLLYRQEPKPAVPERRTLAAHCEHHLPALQQRDDCIRRPRAARGQYEALRDVVAGHLALGLEFLTGTALEWYRLIYREQLHHQHQPVRHHLLFAGRTPCAARHDRIDHDPDRDAADGGRTCEPALCGQTELLSWYWHFVDAVWVVVFITVYVIGR